MPTRSSPDYLTLGQCLENLRNASLLVLQHEQVSDEAKMFIRELIETILHRAQQTDDPSVEREAQAEQHRSDYQVSNPDNLVHSGQIGIDPATGLIFVSNPSTGKTLACSAEDLIAWTRQQGHADL